MVRMVWIGSCASPPEASRGLREAADSGLELFDYQRNGVGHTPPVGNLPSAGLIVDVGVYFGGDTDQRLELVVFTHERPATGLVSSGQRSFAAFAESTATLVPVAFFKRPALTYPNMHCGEIRGLAYQLSTGNRDSRGAPSK